MHETEVRSCGSLEIPFHVGEFWSSRQRTGHSIHEISYRACYKPQLPRFFIDRYTQPGDLVYDPFIGRGTTLIEAQLRGRRAAGNDINRLCLMLAEPRLDPPSIIEVKDRLQKTDLGFWINSIESKPQNIDEDLRIFYDADTLDELYGWRAYFANQTETGQLDKTDKWIRMVATNRLTGHSKGFFSVFTLPPNQAASATAQRRINQKRNQIPQYRDTKALILQKTKNLLRDPLPSNWPTNTYQLVCGPADSTPEIESGSVALAITSPPFLDTVDYLGDNWLRMWFCDIHTDKEKFWQTKSLDRWKTKMRSTLCELKRIISDEGRIAFEVGEIRGGSLPLEETIIEAGTEVDLVPERVFINSQNFTKTANCWGVGNNKKGTNSNRIVVFRKPGSSKFRDLYT